MEVKQDKAITLVLVDDHEFVRVGLRSLLSNHPNLSILGEAGTVEEAVHESLRLKPDVVLLDIRLPDGDGFEACRRIKDSNDAIKVLVLSSFVDDDVVFEAINSGVNGYLLKEIKTSELVRAIEDVASGKSILDPIVTHRVIRRFRRDHFDNPEKRFATLSKQEKRVLALVAEGKTNKEIARELKLSDKTVKNYFSNVLDKLNMSRRAEAAAFYGRFVLK